ncbi:MAG: hypothetical protein ACOYMR_00380 [Ilumatobacteraceae bacterium]
MSAVLAPNGTSLAGSTADTTRRARIAASLDRLDVSWWSVGLFAVLLAFANGFLLTSTQVTVGAIERLSPPFERWVTNALMMVPIYAIAIVAVLYLSRRLAGEGSRPAVRLWTAVGLIVVTSVVVGMAHTGLSALYDYVLQVRHIKLSGHLRHPLYRVDGTTPVLVGSSTCDPTCKAIEATRTAHFSALWLSFKLLLAMDAVIVLWVLGMRGGIVWKHRTVRTATAT